MDLLGRKCDFRVAFLASRVEFVLFRGLWLRRNVLTAGYRTEKPVLSEHCGFGVQRRELKLTTLTSALDAYITEMHGGPLPWSLSNCINSWRLAP